MADLFVRDVRLRLSDRMILPHTYGGSGNHIVVSGTTRLSDFLAMFAAASEARGPFRKMIIACHGQTFTGRIELEFCQERLNVGNVGLLSPLRGNVQRIKLLACQAANPDAGGDSFCGRLAITTGAYVRASRADGVISADSIDRWEGTVITYDPTGTRIRADFFPEDPGITGGNNITP